MGGVAFASVLALYGCGMAATTFYNRYIMARNLDYIRFSDMREVLEAVCSGCSAYAHCLHLLHKELLAVLMWRDRGCNAAVMNRMAVHGYVQWILALHAAAAAAAAADAKGFHH